MGFHPINYEFRSASNTAGAHWRGSQAPFPKILNCVWVAGCLTACGEESLLTKRVPTVTFENKPPSRGQFRAWCTPLCTTNPCTLLRLHPTSPPNPPSTLFSPADVDIGRACKLQTAAPLPLKKFYVHVDKIYIITTPYEKERAINDRV